MSAHDSAAIYTQLGDDRSSLVQGIGTARVAVTPLLSVRYPNWDLFPQLRDQLLEHRYQHRIFWSEDPLDGNWPLATLDARAGVR